jgi:hypothetical protein
MNVYDIYQDKAGNTHLLKSGFSWPGFFLAWIWTAAHRMYYIAAAQFLLWFVCLGVTLSFWYNVNWLYLLNPFSDLSEISPYVFKGLALSCAFLLLSVHVYVGLFCNHWRRSRCDNQGWVRESNILARSKKEAWVKLQK